jgi:hypothetical protein
LLWSELRQGGDVPDDSYAVSLLFAELILSYHMSR